MFSAYSAERVVLMGVSILLVMFSAIVHEVAHGWAAHVLGDDTAKRAGRLTLDPRAHLDPFGSVVLPIVMGLAGGPVFAFAKPVPYDPRRLRHPRRDEPLVALAGPASNIAQALVGTGLCVLALRGLDWALASGTWGYGDVLVVGQWVLTILRSYVYVNLVLAFFNLIPLPPLDGSKLILLFLTGQARQTYHRVSAYSMPILLVALYVLPSYLGIDPLGNYLDVTAGSAFDALMAAL